MKNFSISTVFFFLLWHFSLVLWSDIDLICLDCRQVSILPRIFLTLRCTVHKLQNIRSHQARFRCSPRACIKSTAACSAVLFQSTLNTTLSLQSFMTKQNRWLLVYGNGLLIPVHLWSWKKESQNPNFVVHLNFWILLHLPTACVTGSILIVIYIYINGVL